MRKLISLTLALAAFAVPSAAAADHDDPTNPCTPPVVKCLSNLCVSFCLIGCYEGEALNECLERPIGGRRDD